MQSSRILAAGSWRRAFGEILLIVVGILIALAINAWYEDVIEREQEEQILAQMATTLSEDLVAIRDAHTTILNVDEGISSFIKVIESQSISPGQIATGIHLLNRFVTIQIRYAPYETLKAKGMGLISNQLLREKITTVYEDEIPNLVENSLIDRGLSRNHILPAMLKHFRIDESDRWTPKDPSDAGWQTEMATLGRYRVGTFRGFYEPSFERTMSQMEELVTALNDELKVSE